MNKCNRDQRDLLSRAAAAETGDVEATDPLQPLASALIKRGLMISIPQKDGPSRLMITGAGRASISEAPVAPAVAPPRKRTPKVQALPVAPPSPKGKILILVELLKRPGGSNIAAMMEATGWQAHSVRGAISGAIKKTLGLEVTSERTDAGRIYRIAAEVQP
jgi:hypothetical protein